MIRSNLLFGEQAGLLDGLRGLVPELGREVTTLFEEGSQEGRAFAEVTDAVGASLLDAFDGAIERGESFSDVLKGLALDLAEIALKSAGNSLLESILGGILGGIGGGFGGGIGGGSLGPGISPTGGDIFGTPFAKGGAFAGGRSITAFARGGALTNRILRRPTLFPLADGLGLAGEAGPEAVLPLTRMGSGELGVKAALTRLPEAGGSGPAAAGPTFNIDARGADREGFRELMGLIIQLDGKINTVSRSIPEVSLRAWANHRRRGGFR